MHITSGDPEPALTGHPPLLEQLSIFFFFFFLKSALHQSNR